MIEIINSLDDLPSDGVMLDLETLGTGANSAIISIGAVRFNVEAKRLGSSFYAVIDRQSCFDLGCTQDRDTLDWWNKQSPEARTVLKVPGSDVGPVLAEFADWLHVNEEVWGNGAEFDNAMLAELYRKANGGRNDAQPWKFYNSRCYRTMKAVFPRVTFMRVGTHHNALDDAKSQAIHLMRILDRIQTKQLAE